MIPSSSIETPTSSNYIIEILEMSLLFSKKL